nr:uncharacterized protein LOC101052317 [Saimiri boliviensis boliviensis]
MFVEKVCQLSPFPPRLLVLFILLILPQPSRQPSSTGLSLHQAGARRDHRRADLTKLLERPAYTCCLPSSPPIPSSAHCLLTRSTPWKGSHQGSQCPHKPLLESPCPAEHPPVPPPVGLASGLRTDMCPVPETPRDQALPRLLLLWTEFPVIAPGSHSTSLESNLQLRGPWPGWVS